MYFNAQRSRKPGLRTTALGWASTYPLSQKAGRVTMKSVSNFSVSLLGCTPDGPIPVFDVSNLLILDKI